MSYLLFVLIPVPVLYHCNHSIEAWGTAHVLEKIGAGCKKCAYFHESWGKKDKGEERLSYLSIYLLYIQGGPKKTGPFLRVYNFATVGARNACYMSKFS